MRCLLFSLAALAGCATAGSVSERDTAPESDASLADLAAELVEAAELRADLRQVTVRVDRLEARTHDGRTPETAPELVGLQKTVERELVFALSGRMHVLDDDLAGDVAGPSASHAVHGQLVRMPRELELWVRLVESGSGVIVATAHDRLPVQPFLERSTAWGDAAPVPPELAPPEPESAPASEPALLHPGGVASSGGGETTPAGTPELEPQPPSPDLEPATDPALPPETLATSEPGEPPAVANALPELSPVDGPASQRFRQLDRARKGREEQ